MKNNIVISYLLSVVLVLSCLSSAQAIDIGKVINTTNSAKSADDLLGGNVSKIEKKLNDKIDNITSKIEGEVDKYKEKIDKETKKLTDALDEVQGLVDQAKNLKAKAGKYLMMAKLIIGFLSCGVVASLFFLWRAWRNIVAIKKSIRAAVNYDEVKKRIDNLEKQVALLSKK